MAAAPAFFVPNANKPSENARPVCSRPAPSWHPNCCRRGSRELNTAGGGTTISAARFFQPWLWRARRSAAASARGDSGRARRHHGLATRVLELARRHGWVWVSGLYVSRPSRMPIGFLVIGANDTAAGSGCRGIGDEIVTARSRQVLRRTINWLPTGRCRKKSASTRTASSRSDLASRAPEKFT
jgi:hypothetical protein